MTQDDPLTPRIENLRARAARLGYRLVHTSGVWALLDAEDGVPICAVRSLAEVEQWLDQ
ncbi:hypothetical protein IU510_06835 [Nocardia cyriacigeorgica]|uniref:hypothetical protein n=1 Tax=Nocardia cyriacigeorgica TaxID=135487 RepID=UPI001893EAA0|nr:hypothetical protein [Nocardia cyriacigeorgica]MBF6097792.1 hypothetical protein [Nocardia cyriacigeorgica]MBF6161565.1 hypothetical protein [Nocardia cyriacigeorgica]MBF6200363.1 hypothetical protein [Nocardia cyriacigeorgica]MBF6342171.1 hypothetical protein [Nocardia cyriacigeorgica]MBF6512863.1 hypothetical protein [Nocardia cyriacigeorgica]